jgi:hypothetical protein
MARPLVELKAEEWTSVAKFVTAHRAVRGWSQEQAIAKADRGLSKAPLSQLETGNPRSGRMARTTLEAIQRIYDLPPRWWEQVLDGRLALPSADTMDINSRLARLPDESRQQVVELIDAFERELESRG